MPKQLTYQLHTITSGTTSIVIDLTNPVDVHKFVTSSTVSLASNLSVTVSGTPTLGSTIVINYDADLNFNGNTVTFLGKVINSYLQSVASTIYAHYNGSAWVVSFIPSSFETGYITQTQIADDAITTVKIQDDAITTVKIVDDAVTTDKIVDAAVTVDKLSSTNKKYILTIPVSFESGEQGDNTIIVPFNSTIDKVYYTVTKAISATDSGTISVLIDGTPTVPNTITLAASTAINTNNNLTITSSNAIAGGKGVKFVTLKSTAGGKVLLTVEFTRT